MHPDHSPGALVHAVVDNRFVFLYRPIISQVTGRICGAEALIRRKRRDGTPVQPSEFIPAAEDEGLIADIMLEAIGKWTVPGGREWILLLRDGGGRMTRGRVFRRLVRRTRTSLGRGERVSMADCSR